MCKYFYLRCFIDTSIFQDMDSIEQREICEDQKV